MQHGELGIAQKFLGRVLAVAIDERKAERGGERDLAILVGERRRKRAAQPVGEERDGLGLAFREQEHREFVARDPR